MPDETERAFKRAITPARDRWLRSTKIVHALSTAFDATPDDGTKSDISRWIEAEMARLMRNFAEMNAINDLHMVWMKRYGTLQDKAIDALDKANAYFEEERLRENPDILIEELRAKKIIK